MYKGQTREASGEILRLVIQKMAAHPAAFTPPTYAVWYECTAGINPALSEAMRKLLDAGRKIDNETIAGLIEQHMSSSSHGAQHMHMEIQKLLERLSGFTEETGKQAGSFGDNLQSYGDKLKQNLDQASLNALIGEMEKDTGKVRDSVQDMQSKLEESRKEVEKLQLELDSARGEAMIDPLTELLNRRGFEARAGEMFGDEEAIGDGSCVLMIDIDHFKKVNDTYGHLFGDKVIRGVADSLKSIVKGRDLVARFGGEEFAVLLPQTPVSGAYVLAENIRQGIEKGKIHRQGGQIGGITVSIGIAASSVDSSITESLDRADKALYQSKEQGRNRTTIFG
ncbi:MAG: diguanylate cyclase [Burkholderiales bacterium]|nr:diguanylate cyclase [Burkholderiales bacterium]